jgi:hypothetical protein
MHDADMSARREEVAAATDDVIEIAGELADWFDRNRNNALGSGDRDEMLKALSRAISRLRRIANAS